MAEKTVNDIIYNVCRTGCRDVKDMKEFIENWIKIMRHYDVDIVSKAWFQIMKMPRSMYPDPYFDLSTWDRVSSELHYASKKAQERPLKQSYAQRDSTMASWSENLNKWVSREISRDDYVKQAIETGQFNASDLNYYMAWCKRTGRKMTDKCKSLLRLEV